VDVTALAWNPAALGPLDGSHLYVEGMATLASGQFERDPLDRFPDETTDPLREFLPADYRNLAPGSFLGMSHAFARDRLTAGIGAYTPFVETSEQGDWPGSYYRSEVDWYHLYAPAFAVSFRVGGGFYFGVGLNIVWSWLRSSFNRDLALDLEEETPDIAETGHENEGYAQRVAIDTRGGPDFTAAIGTFYRRRNLNIGVSWQLRPQPVRTEGSVDILPSEEQATELGIPEGERRMGRASAEYRLPDVVHAGVEWRPTERLTTSLALRYVSARLHDLLTIRPSGHDLTIARDDNGDGIPDRLVPLAPESLVFYRGFQDLWALDGAAAYVLHPTVEVGLGAMLETAAMKKRAVNPAQVDGPKVGGRAFASWRPVPWFSIGASWEITVMRDRDVNRSDFDPDAAVRCRESGINVDDCQEVFEGRALPDARGRYGLITQRVVAGISLDRW
jgi:long-subunit fatty acid transport protein